MSIVDDAVNGYIGGHGVRCTLTIAGADINLKVGLFYKNNPDVFKKTCYKITAYNFNPESIKSNNDYGWGSTNYNKKDTAYQQQFLKQNNRQTIELTGHIYPDAFAWLDQKLTSLIQQDDVIQDLKNLKTIADNGIKLLLAEYDASTMTTKNLDYWFIRNIEHTSEVFLYNNRPLKLGYTMTLEKLRPVVKHD